MINDLINTFRKSLLFALKRSSYQLYILILLVFFAIFRETQLMFCSQKPDKEVSAQWILCYHRAFQLTRLLRFTKTLLETYTYGVKGGS